MTPYFLLQIYIDVVLIPVKTGIAKTVFSVAPKPHFQYE
jgi:hypothetical protein